MKPPGCLCRGTGSAHSSRTCGYSALRSLPSRHSGCGDCIKAWTTRSKKSACPREWRANPVADSRAGCSPALPVLSRRGRTQAQRARHTRCPSGFPARNLDAYRGMSDVAPVSGQYRQRLMMPEDMDFRHSFFSPSFSHWIRLFTTKEFSFLSLNSTTPKVPPPRYTIFSF